MPIALRLVAVGKGRADAHGALHSGHEGHLAQAAHHRVLPPLRHAHLPVVAPFQECLEEPLHVSRYNVTGNCYGGK